MRGLASLIGQLPDINDQARVVAVLKAFNKDSLAKHTQVLYPGNYVFRDTGERQDVSKFMNFAEESKQGVHISDDMPSFLIPGRKVIRVFAPVVKDNRVIAMTYNSVYPDEMKNHFKVDIYLGKAQLYRGR